MSSDGTHLYRCYDAAGLLLYIGCSSDPTRRLEQHRHSANKTSRLIQKHATTFEVDADAYPSRDAGRDAEMVAIHAEQPLFNIQHRCIPSWFTDRQIEDYVAGRPVRQWPVEPLPSARVLGRVPGARRPYVEQVDPTAAPSARDRKRESLRRAKAGDAA